MVDSDGHPTLTRFALASHRFAPLSAALGAQWNAAPQWQLSANLAYSERAPKDYELYANGAHVATHAYEVGDPPWQWKSPSTWTWAHTGRPGRIPSA